jgi:hypothetical protein
MRENEAMGRFLVLVLAGLMVPGSAGAQGKKAKPESLAKLELSVEIATTDDDGSPSALRITIRNVGSVPVDMPVLHERCSPDNGGFHIQSSWSPDNPGPGIGSGYGCGSSGLQSLMYRILHDWIRLRPGESMTQTEPVQWTAYRGDGPGTVDCWVDYTPPAATDQEIASLQQAGYIIPTEKLETQHSSFRMH